MFYFVRLAVVGVLLTCLFSGLVVAQEAAREGAKATAAVWSELDRLPEKCDLISIAVRPAKGEKELKSGAAIRKYFSEFSLLLLVQEGFFTEEPSEETMLELFSYESMLHFGRRAQLQEMFSDAKDHLSGGTILVNWPAGAASDRVRTLLEAMPARAFEGDATFGSLRRFEPKTATKKERIFASGELRGRFVLIVTDSMEDWERLTSTEPKKEGRLRKDVRNHLDRAKEHFEKTGFLQVVREKIYDSERVSAYFPSGDDAVEEIRWFQDPITPSYFPSFKDRIGKLEVPPPSWVITMMFSRHKVEAKIIDKHTYEIRRITLAEGPPSDLGVFLNFSRLGEVPEGAPGFQMPKDWGRL